MRRDQNGSWIRDMEQRFRLLVEGRITKELFLDSNIHFELCEDDTLTASVFTKDENGAISSEIVYGYSHGDPGNKLDNSITNIHIRPGKSVNRHGQRIIDRYVLDKPFLEKVKHKRWVG
jgi:hypothetical protein